jgi:hypothetical protein
MDPHIRWLANLLVDIVVRDFQTTHAGNKNARRITVRRAISMEHKHDKGKEKVKQSQL